ncbi:MAG: response regulator [Spirochaetaceae bacterium]|jgi:CheY-like chemotaxis protein|nr:response regulator [Spirochaetaceae bacterium]
MKKKGKAAAGKKVVLAIDDNAMQLKVFQGTLAQNYDIRLVKSASEALYLLKDTTVDVILLDIEMPSVSGFEFLHDIRKIPKYMNVPVIIVTGHTEPDFLESAHNSSAAEVLIKPVSSRTLIESIEKALTMSPKNPFGL